MEYKVVRSAWLPFVTIYNSITLKKGGTWFSIKYRLFITILYGNDPMPAMLSYFLIGSYPAAVFFLTMGSSGGRTGPATPSGAAAGRTSHSYPGSPGFRWSRG